MESQVKVRERYEVLVGQRVFVFENVPLTKSSIGKWGLAVGTVQDLMRSVCVEILVDKKSVLSFDELEFLAKTASKSMSEIAEMVGLSRSMPSHWRSGKAKIDMAHSYCLKGMLAEYIVPNQRGNDSPHEQAKKWRARLGYQDPKVA